MLLYNYKSQNSCPYPVGHERKKIGPRKQGQSSFLRTQLSAFMRISWLCRQSVYRPAPLLYINTEEITVSVMNTVTA